MKSIRDPTTYFFNQCKNPPTEHREKIDEFVSKLINLN